MTMKTCLRFILLLLAVLSLASCKESEKDTALRLVKEWDGKEIFIGDTVKVMNPAWYQNGRVIEQGHCMLHRLQGNGLRTAV